MRAPAGTGKIPLVAEGMCVPRTRWPGAAEASTGSQRISSPLCVTIFRVIQDVGVADVPPVRLVVCVLKSLVRVHPIGNNGLAVPASTDAKGVVVSSVDRKSGGSTPAHHHEVRKLAEDCRVGGVGGKDRPDLPMLVEESHHDRCLCMNGSHSPRAPHRTPKHSKSSPKLQRHHLCDRDPPLLPGPAWCQQWHWQCLPSPPTVN